jgi:hypothetical protein
MRLIARLIRRWLARTEPPTPPRQWYLDAAGTPQLSHDDYWPAPDHRPPPTDLDRYASRVFRGEV